MGSKIRSKIIRDDLEILFFFIPCVVPAMLLEGGMIKFLFNVWRIIAFLFMICCLIKVRHTASKVLIYSSLFSAVIIFSTCVNKGDLNSVFSIAMMMFTIIALSEIQIQKDPARYFKTIGRISWIILLVDTIQIFTEIGFGQLENSTWLGGDNFAIFTVLPMLGIIVLSDGLNYGQVRKSTVIFCILVALAKFKTFAVTSMLAFVVLAICLCVGRYIGIPRIKWLIMVFLVFLLVCLCADFSDIYMKFASLFGKEPYIEHSRLMIWQLSIKAILNKPFMGHGVLDVYDEIMAIAGRNWATCSHTHNYVLELLFRGGIIGTGFYILMLKDYFKVAVQASGNKIILLLKAFLIANMVLWITDSYYAQAPVYVLVVLASHAEVLTGYNFASGKTKSVLG